MTLTRPWQLTIFVLTFLTVAAHILATGPLRDSWWGVHFYAFLPHGWLVTGLLLLTMMQALWVPRVADRLPGVRPVTVLDKPGSWPHRLWPVALCMVGGWLLWLVRTRHVLLGDGSVIAIEVPQGGAFLPREPLVNWIQQGFYALGQGVFTDGVDKAGLDLVAQQSVALGSVVAGALFLAVTWLLASELAALFRWTTLASGSTTSAPTDTIAPLAWRIPLFLLIVGQGYLLLFCGYVEHYAYPTLALSLYLWLSLRAIRTGGTLLLPAMALLLAVGFHLSAAVMGPSFLVLVISRLVDSTSRKHALMELGGILLLVVIMLTLASLLAGGYDMLGTLAEVSRLALTREHEQAEDYLLSSRHWRDFLNSQALIGPLGLFLFVPALLVTVARRFRRNLLWWYLTVSGLAYLTASWLAGESNLGYPRNWDLLAPGGLVFVTAGLGLFLGAMGERNQTVTTRVTAGSLAALWIAVGTSWFHTAPWVALNTSFERSFARFQTLPSTGGLTATNVGRWYLMLGERAEARRWLHQALQESSSNNNAWYLLGRAFEFEGKPTEAAHAYERAVALRPDKVGYREGLMRALVSGGNWSEAVVVGRPLANDPTAGPQALVWYGIALHATGDTLAAVTVLDKVRSTTESGDSTQLAVGEFFVYHGDQYLSRGRWRSAAAAYREALNWDAGQRDARLNLTYCLSEAGDVEAAVQTARNSLSVIPEWPEMLTNLGMLLHGLGRTVEARTYLERSLALAPNQAQAAQVRQLLAVEDNN